MIKTTLNGTFAGRKSIHQGVIMFYFKLSIKGHRIQKLGSLAKLAWIRLIRISCLAGQFFGNLPVGFYLDNIDGLSGKFRTPDVYSITLQSYL